MTDENSAVVEYNLGTDSPWRLVGLMLLCFLAFLLVGLLVLVFMVVGWLESEWSMGVGVVVIFVTPIVLFYGLKRKTRVPAKVRLSGSKVEIERNKISVTLQKADIKSFEALYDEGSEDFDAIGVIIRPVVGKAIRVSTSTWSGNTQEMKNFRRDFEKWAAAQELTRWEPWYRRKWTGSA